MHKVLAMVLAGGRGKRMDMLCYEKPKPALPFAGKFHVIDFSLSNCYHSEVNNIVLLADYQRSYMANYLRRWNAANAISGAFDIREPITGSYKGTADAIYQNLGYLQRNGADRVLVLAGDHVYKMDYRKMLAYHEETGADVTVGVTPIPIEQAERFGTVALGDNNRVVDFVEKSSTPKSNLASMGIYVFNADILYDRLMEDAAQPNSPHDFGYAVMPAMVKRDKVFAYKFDGYWQDIGTMEAYYAANLEIINEKPCISLNGSWPLLTEAQSQSLPRIQSESVRNSIISSGCVVKGRVENSILSPGVWVEEEAVVTDSIIMSNCCIGYHSVVDHCILDEGVNVGKLCYLGFRGSNLCKTEDITVLGKGATIPPHTAVGSSCKIMPYVGLADFTTGMVPSGTVVLPRLTNNTPVAELKTDKVEVN